MRSALAEVGVECFAHPGLHAVDDLDELRTKAGRPYTVFSPFHQAWLRSPRREVVGRPRPLGSLPAGVRRYAHNHDALGADRTSRLSPYLHFGCLSPREVESRLPGGKGADALRRQLCWRDFHHQVLLHFPGNARAPSSRGAIAASCRGTTTRRPSAPGGGVLPHQGLGIDWRAGERWFMRLLIDGDEANTGGSAPSGGHPLQPAPPAHPRILGRNTPGLLTHFAAPYVRRYVPELREVPDEYLREPWTMPEEVQREAGCVIGEHYAGPIVDHREARAEAFARYRV